MLHIFEGLVAIALVGLVYVLWLVFNGAEEVNEPGDITGGKNGRL